MRAVCAAVVAAVVLASCTGADEDVATGGPLPSTDSGAATTAADPAVDIVITRPDWKALATDDVAPPTRDAVPLSEKPVRRASLAVTDLAGDRGVYVLGRDGEWRRVDRPHLTYHVEGGASGTFPALQPNSLDASGTRLAIAQDGSLVVVDLTTGGFRRYRVPGLNQHVAWEDPSHVLVVTSTRMRGTVVDLETGALTESDHRRTTRVLPDGRALTWGGGRGNDSVFYNFLTWDDGLRTTTPGNNSLGATPLVRGDVAVGLHNPTHSQLNPDLLTGDEELDAVMRQRNGVVAVDNINGQVLGFLELSDDSLEATKLLGWLGDGPVLGLVDQSETKRRTYVVWWDYETGELVRLATLPTWYVAWGTGLDGPVRPVVARPDWGSLAVDSVPPLGAVAPTVSDDPLRHAALAVQPLDRPPYVLGTDGRWRLVVAPSPPGSSGSRSEWATRLAPSLDAGGTRIAVPKNHALVVVDLTTGRSRSYAVPGHNWYADWVDDSHVLVVGERRPHALVDLRSGRTEPSTHGWGTRVLPDGSALTWGGGHGNERYLDGALHWDDGRDVTSPTNNAAASSPPLVRNGVAVGLHRANEAMHAIWVSTGDKTLDDLLWSHNGMAAVDSSSGQLLGFLELSEEKFEMGSVVGWERGLPVVALVDMDAWFLQRERAPAYVVRWDCRAGTLDPLAVLPLGNVSWGAGL